MGAKLDRPSEYGAVQKLMKHFCDSISILWLMERFLVRESEDAGLRFSASDEFKLPDPVMGFIMMKPLISDGAN